MEVLLIGNIAYLDKRFIKHVFAEDHVVVMGNHKLKTERREHITCFPFATEDSEFAEVFDSYQFERAIIFSNYLTLHGTREGELEQVRKILQECEKNQVAQIVYLTSLEGCYKEVTGKTEIVTASELLVGYYMKKKQLPIKMVRIPFLYSPEYKDDFLFQKFEEAKKKRRMVFEESPEDHAYFLSLWDLEDLLFRIFDSWDEDCQILNVPDRLNLEFQDVEAGIREQIPEVEETEYLGVADNHRVPEDDKVLRHKYGWFQKISIVQELPELVKRFQENQQEKKTWMGIAAEIIKKQSVILKSVELVLAWAASEWLSRLAGNSAQFRVIDIRLLFVVLMASVYGMNFGLAAAGLASLSVVYTYSQMGIQWMTLFYEPSNWLIFIGYFLAGAICGYVRLKNREDLRFERREKDLITEKFFFIHQLYEDTLQDKRRYKKQIIGSKDSFGKIFSITQRLEVTRKEEVFHEAILILEELLDNVSIAIYSVEENRKFGRLEAFSKQMGDILPKSIAMADYEQVRAVLEEGQVWKNVEMIKDYPAYMIEIAGKAKRSVMITIWQASYEQMGLYYVNLIKILCGLIENAMLRALDYQELERERRYVAGTNILCEREFVRVLQVRHDMQEQKKSRYELLRLCLPGRTIQEIDELLLGRVRGNDVLGMGSDGSVYLILTQADVESRLIVENRLKQCGFQVSAVEQMSGDKV